MHFKAELRLYAFIRVDKSIGRQVNALQRS